MKNRFAVSLCAVMTAGCVFLTGCASLLERRYVTAEPHSSKYWESEVSGTLRAENYQDIVNDLLLLIDRHTESATLRLYHFDDETTVADILENAAMEIQQQTPLGSYAVSYITSTSQAQRGYYEIKVQISYRRSAEQLQNIVNATSAEAVYTLLREAYEAGRGEVAVRIGYWGVSGPGQVEDALARLRADRAAAEHPADMDSELSDVSVDALSDDTDALSGDTDEPSTDHPDDDPPSNTPANNTTTPADDNPMPVDDTSTPADDTPSDIPDEPSAPDDTPSVNAEEEWSDRESYGGEFADWPIVYYYPEDGPVGLIEFLLDVPEPDMSDDADSDQPENDSDAPENKVDASEDEAQTPSGDTSSEEKQPSSGDTSSEEKQPSSGEMSDGEKQTPSGDIPDSVGIHAEDSFVVPITQ